VLNSPVIARWLQPAAWLIVSLLTIGPSASPIRAQSEPPRKLLLLGQSPDGHPAGTHEYMPGMKLLAKCLSGTPGLEITIRNADEPFTEGPDLLAQADACVIFVSQGAAWVSKDSRRLQAFQKLAQRKGGLGCLHWGMGVKEVDPIVPFTELFGGCHGGPDRKYRVVEADVNVASDHPITQGIANFRVHDEFYYHLKFFRPGTDGPVLSHPREPGFKSLWQVRLDDQPETVAWAWERPNSGRSFGFSGLHFHRDWEQVAYQRLLTQSVLWSLRLPIPASGVPSVLTKEDLQ